MKLLEKKRDELAHARAIEIDKKYNPNEFTVYANARRSYIKGFDAAVKELEPIFLQAIEEVKSWYPVDVFPEEGASQDAMSAMVCRLTCDNILKEYKIKTGEVR